MSQAGNLPQVTPKPIFDAAFAFARTYLLASAVELDLFTRIDDGDHTVAALAQATGCSERGLRLLLNALTASGFAEKHGERFGLTPTAKTFLSRNSPSYLGGWLRHVAQIQPAWSKLTEVVRTRGSSLAKANPHTPEPAPMSSTCISLLSVIRGSIACATIWAGARFMANRLPTNWEKNSPWSCSP